MTYHLTTVELTVISLLAIWELVWKAIALWKAAKNKHLAWFVVILVINTVGILPIAYILTHKDPPAGPEGVTDN